MVRRPSRPSRPSRPRIRTEIPTSLPQVPLLVAMGAPLAAGPGSDRPKLEDSKKVKMVKEIKGDFKEVKGIDIKICQGYISLTKRRNMKLQVDILHGTMMSQYCIILFLLFLQFFACVCPLTHSHQVESGSQGMPQDATLPWPWAKALPFAHRNTEKKKCFAW